MSFKNLSCFLLAITYFFITGCGNEKLSAPPVPVNFVAANPPSGSRIKSDTIITVIFEAVPGDVSVNQGTVTLADQMASIYGPFPEGLLQLLISWDDLHHIVLSYIVTELESPSPGLPEGMRLIPAGKVQLQVISFNDPAVVNDKQPVYTAFVDAFYMDEREVTNSEYKEFVDANPHWQKDRIARESHNGDYLEDWHGNDYPSGEAALPVTYVTWYAAMAYAKWVGKRLPTEAEWLHAAEGGQGSAHNPSKIVEQFGDVDSILDMGEMIPTVRGTIRRGGDSSYLEHLMSWPNGYGLVGMSNGVLEWCLDEYRFLHENPLSGANNIDWVMSNFTSIKTQRVVYGGPVDNRLERELGQGVTRLGVNPRWAIYKVGFRCAMSQ